MPAPQRFERSQRLTNAREFSRAFARSQRSSDEYFTVLAHRGRGVAARLGLTISKRAAKRAIDRNRLKRIARETFRQKSGLPAWDFIVVAKPAAATAPNRELRLSLERHFAKLALKGAR